MPGDPGRTVRVGAIELWYQTFGRHGREVLLLLMGNGCSATFWPEPFCRRLADEGDLLAVRYDHRDTGRSTRVDPRRAPYRLDDLERDAWGLLDHLGARRAHLAGLSMGGFIAQRMALAAPSRVLSLAAISSTPDYATTLHAFGMCEPPTSGLPAPRAEWLDRIDRLSPDLSLIDFQLESWRYANGPRAPFDAAWWRALQAEANERGDDRAAGARHRRAAVPIQPKNLLPALRSLAVPALFVHGTDDPICPPEHARAAAAAAPKARLHLIETMGHALGPPFLDEVAGAVLAGIRAARARGTGGAGQAGAA